MGALGHQWMKSSNRKGWKKYSQIKGEKYSEAKNMYYLLKKSDGKQYSPKYCILLISYFIRYMRIEITHWKISM